MFDLSNKFPFTSVFDLFTWAQIFPSLGFDIRVICYLLNLLQRCIYDKECADRRRISRQGTMENRVDCPQTHHSASTSLPSFTAFEDSVGAAAFFAGLRW